MGKRLEHIFVDGIEYKKCGFCNEWKELYKFSKNNNKVYWDRLQNYCKICKNKYKINPVYRKGYWSNNREYLLIKKKEYREKHKDSIMKKSVEYIKNRRKTDVGFKIRHNLSRRICYAIDGRAKSEATMELLGCSVDHFKKYLEKRFSPEMNWDNYGTYWEIDHIKPCRAFDLSDPEQQKTCFHYTNLQPLEKSENRKKNDKINGVSVRHG